MGVAPRVLKVIPAPDGEELDPASELADLLRAEQAAGSETVQHGYTHRRAGALRGSLLDEWRARTFAPDDAEFLSLDPEVARSRLLAGRETLERCGLSVSGFCAPGWLASPWVDDLVAAEGFRYSIGLMRLVDHGSRRHRTVPAFGYMGAGAVQERLVGVGGDLSIGLHRWLPGEFPHLRAVLHPQGASSSDDCARVLAWIGRHATTEPMATYRAVLDGWPEARGR